MIKTVTGGGLAAFLRGLLPETKQFDRQISDIEAEAVDAFIRDELQRMLLVALVSLDEPGGPGIWADEDTAAALAIKIADIHRDSHGTVDEAAQNGRE